MVKAYNRVSWFFLMKVLRKMVFSNRVVDIIRRLISNNYYSVLLDGQLVGFFHSIRGVKQGDPLAPALLILAAQVVARSLNQFFEDTDFIGYSMPKWSPELNHLAYVDDTIVFTSSNKYSINKRIQILKEYEL